MTRVLLSANTDWYLYNFRLSLARYMRDQGIEMVLVSPPGRYAADLQAAGFRWVRWALGRQTLAPWQELGALLRLAAIYRQEQPDLVHHHTIKPVLYGSLAARLAGKPAVVNSITGRGYIFLGEELRARLLRLVVRPVYHTALQYPRMGVIFENSTDRQYFINNKMAPAGRTWLIEGVGVDPQRFQPLPELPGPPLIVLPARMLWDKGVGVLVKSGTTIAPSPESARCAGGRARSGQSCHSTFTYTTRMASYRCNRMVGLESRHGECVPACPHCYPAHLW